MHQWRNNWEQFNNIEKIAHTIERMIGMCVIRFTLFILKMVSRHMRLFIAPVWCFELLFNDRVKLSWPLMVSGLHKIQLDSRVSDFGESSTVTCHQQPRPPDLLRRPQRVVRHDKLGNYVKWPAWGNWNVFLFNWCLYSSEILDCKSQ